MILNFKVRLREKEAFALVVTAVSMLCFNLLALRLNVNRQKRNLLRVREDLKLNHNSPATTSGVLEKLCLFVARKAKRKLINGMHF